MKAYLRSARIAPKKANLIAKMIRGLPVTDALFSLEKTNKKAARILETLLKSAIANAHNNDNQNPNDLVIKSLIVNQGQAYHRGVPMARGRVRPMRKFLSHISLTLGVVEQQSTVNSKQAGLSSSKKTKKDPSQKLEKKVKKNSSKRNSSDLEEGSSLKKKKTTSNPKVSADSDSSTPKK